MARLQSLEWFHGTISKDVAERRLRARIDNTFLVRSVSLPSDHTIVIDTNLFSLQVRLSLNDPAATPFTISRIRNSRPTHKRVTRLANGVLSAPVENYTIEYP